MHEHSEYKKLDIKVSILDKNTDDRGLRDVQPFTTVFLIDSKIGRAHV